MRKILILFFLVSTLTLMGQEKYEINEDDYNNQNVEMADTMRSDGKIYVVVGVITIILLVLLGYVIKTEGRIKKLENQLAKTDKNHEDLT